MMNRNGGSLIFSDFSFGDELEDITIIINVKVSFLSCFHASSTTQPIVMKLAYPGISHRVNASEAAGKVVQPYSEDPKDGKRYI